MGSNQDWCVNTCIVQSEYKNVLNINEEHPQNKKHIIETWESLSSGSFTWTLAHEMMFWPVAKKISCKDNFICSSGCDFVLPSWMARTFLVEGITRNIYMKYFEFGSAVQEEMSFKNITSMYLELWWPFRSVQPNQLCIWIGGNMRIVSVKLYCIWTSDSGGDVVYRYYLSRV